MDAQSKGDHYNCHIEAMQSPPTGYKIDTQQTCCDGLDNSEQVACSIFKVHFVGNQSQILAIYTFDMLQPTCSELLFSPPLDNTLFPELKQIYKIYYDYFFLLFVLLRE